MIKILAASAALALAAGSAMASPSANASIVVRTSDLDIANPADQQRLQKRLETAALEVCGAQRDSARMVKIAIKRSDCFHETLAQASSQVQTSMAVR